MSELGRPSGQNIAAPLFDKCIEQLGKEVAAARAHENEGDGLPRPFLRSAARAESWDGERWRAREIIMRTAAAARRPTDSAIFAVIH